MGRLATWHVAAALSLLCVVRYTTALSGGFVLDDGRAVAGNRCVARSPAPLTCAFTHDFWGRPAGEVGRSYRPLVVLTFAVDWAIGGGGPFAFHLTNVVLHAGATLAVFFLLLGLARCAERPKTLCWPAVLGAGLFAVFGVHTDAVAGIVGRADVLATGLSVAALTLHLRWQGGRGSLVAIGGLCLAAMLCHEVAVVTPGLILVVDGLRGGREMRKKLPVYIVVAVVTAGYLLLRVVVLGRIVGPPPSPLNNPAVEAAALGRVLFALASVGRAVGLILLPLELSAEYGHAAVTVPKGIGDDWVLIGVGATAALVVGAFHGRRRSPLLAAGCGILLLGLYLVSNGPVLLPTAFAERLLYLPTVGAAAIMGGLPALWPGRPLRLFTIGLGVLLLVGNLIVGFQQNRHWRNSISLFQNATQSCPESARAHLNLGLALNSAGHHRRAIPSLRRALAIEPGLVDAAVELAMAHDMAGEAKRARQLFEAVLRKAPRYRHALHNYARFLMRHGEAGRARELLKEHLRRDPKDGTAGRIFRHLR